MTCDLKHTTMAYRLPVTTHEACLTPRSIWMNAALLRPVICCGSRQAIDGVRTGKRTHQRAGGYAHSLRRAVDTTKDEKKAILASWASDICAMGSMLAWRLYPRTEHIVSYDEVLATSKALDGDDQDMSVQKQKACANDNRDRRWRHRWHRPGGSGLCSYRKGANTHSRSSHSL
jgi:hypothetical protein